MFDDDFDFFTGGFGDMNGDGGIDFDEFMNQEYEYQQFAESHSKVGNFIFNNNDDWEIDNIDTAAEYSLNPYDYADKEEFCDTLFSAKSETESYEVNFDYEEPAVCAAQNDEPAQNDAVPESIEPAEKDTEPDTVSAEDYNKLKNENKALKAKITRLENRITDLNYNVQRLEAALATKRRREDWDGKSYRYCKVVTDEHHDGLWYRTDDITLKKGDYVFVPYGYKNEELMAKVVEVCEFRSDDLPFPLENTQFILEKCDT